MGAEGAATLAGFGAAVVGLVGLVAVVGGVAVVAVVVVPVWHPRQRRCVAGARGVVVFGEVAAVVVGLVAVFDVDGALGIVWQRRHSTWRWLPCESGAIQSGSRGAGAEGTAKRRAARSAPP